MRNLDAVLPPASDGVYHLIVTDQFYTSVQLAYQLLQWQVYCVGTIQGDKQGFCNAIGEKNRDRPRSIPHGTTRMAVAKNCPSMTSLVWWDRRPVQLLGTGGSRRMESCFRWRPGGVHAEVPCPSMMRDYHRWMGGVDVHNQLRLQRYSLQQQTKCKKYYKVVFLGLVDIAIVNAYVVFRDVQKQREAKPQTHAEFLMHLQAQMLEVTEEDFAQVRSYSIITCVSHRSILLWQFGHSLMSMCHGKIQTFKSSTGSANAANDNVKFAQTVNAAWVSVVPLKFLSRVASILTSSIERICAIRYGIYNGTMVRIAPNRAVVATFKTVRQVQEENGSVAVSIVELKQKTLLQITKTPRTLQNTGVT
ncbi:hypothetical protein L914_19371, partial [Phytophthora nicotianae]